MFRFLIAMMQLKSALYRLVDWLAHSPWGSVLTWVLVPLAALGGIMCLRAFALWRTLP